MSDDDVEYGIPSGDVCGIYSQVDVTIAIIDGGIAFSSLGLDVARAFEAGQARGASQVAAFLISSSAEARRPKPLPC